MVYGPDWTNPNALEAVISFSINIGLWCHYGALSFSSTLCVLPTTSPIPSPALRLVVVSVEKHA